LFFPIYPTKTLKLSPKEINEIANRKHAKLDITYQCVIDT